MTTSGDASKSCLPVSPYIRFGPALEPDPLPLQDPLFDGAKELRNVEGIDDKELLADPIVCDLSPS